MSTQSVSRFTSVLLDELRALKAVGQRRDFSAGEVIFSAGDPGDGFYLVESGRVRIEAAAGEEGARLLATIGPGDFFGEMAVLDDAPRSASASAEVATGAIFLGRDELLRLLHQQPRLALDLIRDFSGRMRTLNRRYLDDILQAERLATVGRLARSTVHDFKNPLAIISLAAELAGRAEAAPESRQRVQETILKQVERMNSMLHELIEFTRTGQQEFVPTKVKYADFLSGIEADLQHELAERKVRLVTTPPAKKLEVEIDARRLPRLFHNLIGNAVDAMGKQGGVITITTEVKDDFLHTELTDSGPGIAPEVAERLFQPFATHGKAHGTGLGLSICRRIAEDHGGRIWARSKVGQGATFGFSLPLSRK
ncbi:MAG TPA: ATP-binding protein [Opitutaceae bacterium]